MYLTPPPQSNSRLSRSSVQTFDITSRGHPHVRGTSDGSLLRDGDFSRTVSALWNVRVVVHIGLDNLRVNHVSAEGQFHSLDIGPQSIAGKLDSILEP